MLRFMSRCLKCVPVAWYIVVFHLGLAQGAERDIACVNAKPFYDGTLYRDKATAEIGTRMLPIRVVYAAEIWPDKRFMQRPPSPADVLRIAASVPPKTAYVVLDIEHWHHSDTSVAARGNVQRLKQTLEAFKKAMPTQKLGVYGLPPVQDYWRAISAPESRAFRSWQSANEQLAVLRSLLDASFPSLYTFYDDESGWLNFATSQINEARRILPGKPVIPFIWPEFHESSHGRAGMYLPPKTWARELESMCELADGAVIWGGWNQSWNSHADWWHEVLKAVPPLSDARE